MASNDLVLTLDPDPAVLPVAPDSLPLLVETLLPPLLVPSDDHAVLKIEAGDGGIVLEAYSRMFTTDPVELLDYVPASDNFGA